MRVLFAGSVIMVLAVICLAFRPPAWLTSGDQIANAMILLAVGVLFSLAALFFGAVILSRRP